MSAALGAAIDGKRRQQSEQATETSKPARFQHVPVKPITVGVTGTFVVCAAVYHLVIAPQTGMFV